MNSCVYPANTNGISIDFCNAPYNFVIKQGGVFIQQFNHADLRNNYNEISTFCHTVLNQFSLRNEKDLATGDEAC